jgi:hypothetical protein
MARGLGGRFGLPKLGVVALLLLGCGGGAPPDIVDQAADVEGAPREMAAEGASLVMSTSAPADGGGEVPDSLTFAERVMVFVTGTAEDIDEMRASHDEDDFYIAADDANWYRATAIEFLEERQLPIRYIEGRRPLYFVVAGEARLYDLSEVSTLDVVILYDTDREPCILTPVDVPFAEAYFTGVPTEYGWDPCARG